MAAVTMAVIQIAAANVGEERERRHEEGVHIMVRQALAVFGQDGWMAMARSGRG